MASSEPDRPNPYQTPQSDLTPEPAEPSEITALSDAQFWFRGGMLVLAVPALINFVAFDQVFVSTLQVPPTIRWYYFAINLTMLSALGLSLWLWGYRLLEWFLVLIRRWFFPAISSEASRSVVRRRAQMLFVFTFAPSFAWLIWLASFYLGLRGMAVVFSLLVAASFFLVLFWFAMVRGGWGTASRKSQARPTEVIDES